jgi:hypothetical protein
MKKWTLVLALISTVALAGTVEAKKTKPKPSKEPAAPQAPKRNFLDLRQAQFFCNDSACAVDLVPLNLIGCSVNGCASITDLIVSTGPMTRAPQQPPK